MLQASQLRLITNVRSAFKRNVAVFAPLYQKVSDPIQQLFLDKIREYKSKSSGGKLLEPSPELENELKSERERIIKQFEIKPEDAGKFPEFKFTDPPLEWPGIPKSKDV